MTGRNLFASFSEKTVLIVDDSDMNNSVIKAILERCGMNVLVAQNGVDALEKFSQSEPNSICAILMDISMPVMDGCEAARKIRALDRPDSATVPIIAVTASVEPRDKEKTIDCGMTDFVTKPVSPESIYQALSRHLE